MFLLVSVILSTEGAVCLSACWDTPPRSRPPWEQTHPPEQTPPRADTPPRSRYPTGADTSQSRHPAPRKQTPAYGQWAAGTHPTGMHSCDHFVQRWTNSGTNMHSQPGFGSGKFILSHTVRCRSIARSCALRKYNLHPITKLYHFACVLWYTCRPWSFADFKATWDRTGEQDQRRRRAAAGESGPLTGTQVNLVYYASIGYYLPSMYSSGSGGGRGGHGPPWPCKNRS